MPVELTSQADFEDHLLFLDNGDLTAEYENISLASVFQPIVDRDWATVGFEALCRVRDQAGISISSEVAFGHEFDETRIAHQRNLDRLSRVIHLRNFSNYEVADALVFVNILPASAISVLASEVNLQLLIQRLDAIGIDSRRVILEVLEHGLESDRSLAIATAQHLASGFQIAIDDFGVDASREERVRSVRPNILKIDRSLLELYFDGETERLLMSLELASEVGAKTLIEGIEHEHEFDAMVGLGIDLFQGFYLGEPKHLSAFCSKKA